MSWRAESLACIVRTGYPRDVPDEPVSSAYHFIAIGYLIGMPGIILIFVLRGLVREALGDL
jgi:hypothetical protein